MVSNLLNGLHKDEKKLIGLLKQGDQEAYRVLVRQYQQMVFRIAFGITLDREESLDIAQEVFLKVYQKIHTFEQKAALSTWLHRITVNQSLNWKRRWKRRFRGQHQPLENSGALEPGTENQKPERLYQDKELGRMMQEGLKELPADARAVFVLKEIEGLSYDEIAATLSIKRGTVSSRLFYARKRLRERLREYVDET